MIVFIEQNMDKVIYRFQRLQELLKYQISGCRKCPYHLVTLNSGQEIMIRKRDDIDLICGMECDVIFHDGFLDESEIQICASVVRPTKGK